MSDKPRTSSDNLARLFDFIFGKFLFEINIHCLAVGFGCLAVFFIFATEVEGVTSFAKWVLIGYYCFFCGFMVLAAIQSAWLMKYCGFLKGFLTKTIFYCL